MVAFELLHAQNNNDGEQQEHGIAQRSAEPRACTAKRRNSKRTVHEYVIEDNVDRHNGHGDKHREPRFPMCIHEVAQNARRRNRDHAKRDVGQILHRDIFDDRLEIERLHKHRNSERAQRQEKRAKKRRPVESLPDDAPDLPPLLRTVMMCNHRSQPRDQPDKRAEYGEEDARADSDAGEILLADMSRHDSVEESRCHERELRDENRKEHNEELAGTRPVTMNFLQVIPPLLILLSEIIRNAVRNAAGNLLDARLTVHHTLLVCI